MPVPALIAAAGALTSTLLGMKRSDHANSLSHKYDDLNAWLAIKDYEFNRDYTMNQYQHTADDMSKAGINPLIMGSGAGSSSVSGGNVNVGPSSVADLSAIGNVASSILASKTQADVAEKSSKTQKDVADQSSDTQKSIASDNLEFSREKLKVDSEIRKQELEIERQNSEAQLLKAQADVAKAEAETRNIDTNTEDVRYELDGRREKGSYKDDGNYSRDFKSGYEMLFRPYKELYNTAQDIRHSLKARSALSDFDRLNSNKYYWNDKDLANWLKKYNLSDDDYSAVFDKISDKLKKKR